MEVKTEKFHIGTSKNFTTENLEEEIKSKLSFKEKLSTQIARKLTKISGSMNFLIANALFFLIWILWNLELIPGLKAFDPFPFGLLTMIVSLLAIFLSIIVLITQNNQGKIADVRQQVDFEINVRAENEITKILNMLEKIENKLGIPTSHDKELKEMKTSTDVEEIREKVEELEDKVEGDN